MQDAQPPQEPDHGHILSQSPTVECGGCVVDVFFPALSVPQDDLQATVVHPGHLEREDDDHRDGREELNGRELARRSQTGELTVESARLRLMPCCTHQIAIENVVDQLEEELVQEKQSSRPYFSGQNEERDACKKLDG